MKTYEQLTEAEQAKARAHFETELLTAIIEGGEWLAQQFEFEYCAECGGDAQHHTAVPFLGTWFARCDYPPDDTGKPHFVIRKFRGDDE